MGIRETIRKLLEPDGTRFRFISHDDSKRERHSTCDQPPTWHHAVLTSDVHATENVEANIFAGVDQPTDRNQQ